VPPKLTALGSARKRRGMDVMAVVGFRQSGYASYVIYNRQLSRMGRSVFKNPNPRKLPKHAKKQSVNTLLVVFTEEYTYPNPVDLLIGVTIQ
jgi:hypothetical protein